MSEVLGHAVSLLTALGHLSSRPLPAPREEGDVHGGRGSAPGLGLHVALLPSHLLPTLSCVLYTQGQETRAPSRPFVTPPPLSRRFLLQLVGILLEDIVSKQLRVDMSEQQHTFYCQELGTLLMCLIHIFKSGGCPTDAAAQPASWWPWSPPPSALSSLQRPSALCRRRWPCGLLLPPLGAQQERAAGGSGCRKEPGTNPDVNPPGSAAPGLSEEQFSFNLRGFGS